MSKPTGTVTYTWCNLTITVPIDKVKHSKVLYKLYIENRTNIEGFPSRYEECFKIYETVLNYSGEYDNDGKIHIYEDIPDYMLIKFVKFLNRIQDVYHLSRLGKYIIDKVDDVISLHPSQPMIQQSNFVVNPDDLSKIPLDVTKVKIIGGSDDEYVNYTDYTSKFPDHITDVELKYIEESQGRKDMIHLPKNLKRLSITNLYIGIKIPENLDYLYIGENKYELPKSVKRLHINEIRPKDDSFETFLPDNLEWLCVNTLHVEMVLCLPQDLKILEYRGGRGSDRPPIIVIPENKTLVRSINLADQKIHDGKPIHMDPNTITYYGPRCVNIVTHDYYHRIIRPDALEYFSR